MSMMGAGAVASRVILFPPVAVGNNLGECAILDKDFLSGGVSLMLMMGAAASRVLLFPPWAVGRDAAGAAAAFRLVLRVHVFGAT